MSSAEGSTHGVSNHAKAQIGLLSMLATGPVVHGVGLSNVMARGVATSPLPARTRSGSPGTDRSRARCGSWRKHSGRVGALRPSRCLQ